jgi:hypothetical protein
MKGYEFEISSFGTERENLAEMNVSADFMENIRDAFKGMIVKVKII